MEKAVSSASTTRGEEQEETRHQDHNHGPEPSAHHDRLIDVQLFFPVLLEVCPGPWLQLPNVRQRRDDAHHRYEDKHVHQLVELLRHDHQKGDQTDLLRTIGERALSGTLTTISLLDDAGDAARSFGRLIGNQ